MLAFVSSAVAFSPSASLGAACTVPTRSVPAVAMSESFVGRREMLNFAAAAVVATPFAAVADGATSKATRERARQIYGSRIFRVQGGTTAQILEEANAFDIFITGAYGGLVKNKPITVELKAIKKDILAAAKKGDSGAAQAGVKKFVEVASINKAQDEVEGGNYNPKQRRNAGAPPTSEIEAQMGTSAYALYEKLSPEGKASSSSTILKK